MTRTWYLAAVIVDDKINNGINMFLRCWPFDGHGGPLVQYNVHRLMQHVQGYYGSHYLLCITPAAASLTGKQTTINKYTYKAGRFDGHGNAPVLNRTHCPMEEVQGFTRSHWMLAWGKYYVQ